MIKNVTNPEMKCITCDSPAKIKTAKDANPRCVECFKKWFEMDVDSTIRRTRIFERGDRIAIGVSGGKDSTVLAFVVDKLNKANDYGIQLLLICVDEGIAGYRDESIREVRKNEIQLDLPLTVVSYKEIYGWTMDEIVAKIGTKSNCTFCGVFRRQALDRAAIKAGACKLATGHNADDMAETFLMNVLRGDVARLQRTATHVTSGDNESLPRLKPLKYSYEKDIVMYAHFGKLDYFSTECIYSPNSYRSNVRTFIKNLERERSRAILDLIYSSETMLIAETVQRPTLSKCERCGYISSQRFCKACQLIEGLARDSGIPEQLSQDSQQTPKDKPTPDFADMGCGDCHCQRNEQQTISF